MRRGVEVEALLGRESVVLHQVSLTRFNSEYESAYREKGEGGRVRDDCDFRKPSLSKVTLRVLQVICISS